jgi:hypothetical protein
MNNEPVAWMELYYGEPNNLSWTDAELRDSGEVYKTIPLYTHSVKELTDEEISQVYKEVSEPFGEKRLYEIHDFARAILRKAQ